MLFLSIWIIFLPFYPIVIPIRQLVRFRVKRQNFSVEWQHSTFFHQIFMLFHPIFMQYSSLFSLFSSLFTTDCIQGEIAILFQGKRHSTENYVSILLLGVIGMNGFLFWGMVAFHPFNLHAILIFFHQIFMVVHHRKQSG